MESLYLGALYRYGRANDYSNNRNKSYINRFTGTIWQVSNIYFYPGI